jgi:hypothetical protein
MKFYELNERYHDTKEKMAWLATSLYAAFSIALLKWMMNKEYKNFITENYLLILIVLTVIFICAIWFINFHYYKKRNSVRIDGKTAKEIIESEKNEIDQMAEIFDYRSSLKPLKNWKNRKTNNEKLFAYHSTEIPIHLLMICFFFAQVFTIFSIKSG